MHYKKSYFIIVSIAVIISLFAFFCFQKRRAISPDPLIPFDFSLPEDLSFPENTCDISDFGGVPDGITLNTNAFSRAIEDCARRGGGTVYVPDGKWLTGAIHLQNDINLNLAKNAEIIFSTDPNDYLPAVFTRFEGMELYNYSPFIYANGVHNAAITGSGILNGQGQVWMGWKAKEFAAAKKLYEMAKNNIPVEKRVFASPDNALRPSLIQFINSHNIQLDGPTIINSPRWTVHLTYSDQAVIRNLNVNTIGHNTDGIVIDSSKNVLVENTSLKTGDDVIVIKSGLDFDGWRVNKPSENIVIRNCYIEDGHSGVAIGSEMSGGVKNILISGLRMKRIDQGIRIKSIMGRGGVVENIWARDIKIGEAAIAAYDIDFNYESATLKSESNEPPAARNIYVSNLTAGNAEYAIKIKGLKNSLITGGEFENINASSAKGISLRNCENFDFKKIKIENMAKLPIFKIINCQNIRY